jgi:hypothetical protein
MAIKYTKSMKLQLWVWDTGDLEGFSVYLNGELLDDSDAPDLAYDIDRPEKDSSSAIVVHFNGIDGGATKVVDVSNDAKPKTVEHQNDGLKHSYLVTA